MSETRVAAIKEIRHAVAVLRQKVTRDGYDLYEELVELTSNFSEDPDINELKIRDLEIAVAILDDCVSISGAELLRTIEFQLEHIRGELRAEMIAAQKPDYLRWVRKLFN